MNRRELLAAFGAGVLASDRLAAQEPAPEFSALDHIEFYVSNVEKSRDFFVRVFGNSLLSRNNKRYLKLGASYMAFEQPRVANGEIKVDHVSVAIKGLEMPKLHAFLEQCGVAYQDYPSGRDTAVVDPDGIRLQLSPENGWSLLNPATFLPEGVELTEEPIFRPGAMAYVLLNVKELGKAVAFYQKFLGVPVLSNDVDRVLLGMSGDGIWFQVGSSRIGLQQTPAGQKEGVQLFALTGAPYEPVDAIRKLQRLGVGAERMPSDHGGIRFSTPDGLSILQFNNYK